MERENKEQLIFEVEPNIVEHLGRNLYSADNSIIIELIANSYDADASKVEIIFDKINKTLTIQDNGIGMNKDIIENYFLKVGKNNKKNKTTKIYNRKPLGSMGIGRLSFFALGDLVRVETVFKNKKSVFLLDYERLKQNEKNIEFQESIVDDVDSYTKITISKLQEGILQESFFKSVILGCKNVFQKLLNKDFKIYISGDEFILKNHNAKNTTQLKGKYEITIEEPDFNKNLVFFSLDKESDNLLEKVKKDSMAHLAEIREKSALESKELSLFMNSEETWEFIKANKNFQNDKVLKEENGQPLLLKGYITSIITPKILGKTQQEASAFKNDAVLVDEFNKNFVVKNSNRRISLHAKGRSGDMNIKSKVSLADKFYTKYLSGSLEMEQLDDDTLEPVALPHREGYRRNNPRWKYLSTITKILGDSAMNFSNNIAKQMQDVAKKQEENKINKLIQKFKVEIKYEKDEAKKEKIITNAIVETSNAKANLNNIINSFVMISYKSKNNKSEYSQKESLKFAYFLKDIHKESKCRNVKFFYMNNDKNNFADWGNALNKKLYVTIKEGIGRDNSYNVFKDPHYYTNFHIFCFVDEEYIKSWNTSLEYGMAYGNTNLSEDKLPIDITTFVPKESRDELSKKSILSQDNILTFPDYNWLINNLKSILEKVFIDIDEKKLVKIIKKHYG